ncbi:tRNA modification GTPase gtpbp3, mitochondrial [Linnemannia zychae]|nr:tRNA modification GTPase gtpbp3, mitochondrial [Linnemannia zychae]
MVILDTSSIQSPEDQLILKPGLSDGNLTIVDTFKTTGSLPHTLNTICLNIDNSKSLKELHSSRCTIGDTLQQIQASAYIHDSETLSIPVRNTEEADHSGLQSSQQTALHSKIPETETDKCAYPSAVPSTTIIPILQPETPPSQTQPKAMPSTRPHSNTAVSSSISILSASGTLISDENQRQLSISTAHHPSHPLSRTTTAHTLVVSSAPFDARQFKEILQKLTVLVERFETLNDQILDALTSYDESRLGLDFVSATGSHSTSEPKSPNKTSTSIDLEVERRVVAQSLVELIFTAWSRLAGAGSSTVYPPSNLPIQTHSPLAQKMVRLNKSQMKAATHLKSIIVTFWSAQSNLQDLTQLVLEVLQVQFLIEFIRPLIGVDPMELEDEGRARSLRSRHLNNLLSTSLSPSEVNRLNDKVKMDQERMTQITEQIQGIWLEILLVLSQPASKSDEAALESDESSDESNRKWFFRFSKHKRLAFKNLLKNWVSTRGANAFFSMGHFTGTCGRTFHSRSILYAAEEKKRPTELRYLDTHLDTIFALSTHPGKAGIAVIRVSGPQAKSVCPRSFTGEDSVEFHCHGGKAVVEGILRGIGNTGSHIRLAEPGEFARRAFENNKLDLTEVEGLADLLNAETEAQRRLALRQADGGLKNLYESWRTQLIQSMALIEALIDFGEDENIEDDVYDNVVSKVKTLHREIKKHTDDDRCGEILRDGIHVTILGPPNAGKSSFLNFITKRQAAIVSPIPGTTRDVVEVSLNIGGYPIIIGDTAGLRTSQDEIEMEGVRRAQDRIRLADINIAILPVTDFIDSSNNSSSKASIDPIVLEAVKKNPKTMVLINKMDLPGLDNNKTMAAVRCILKGDTKQDAEEEHMVWPISCQTGEGIGQFLQDFIRILKDRFESNASSSTSITQYRHRKHLENCLQSLEAFLDMGLDDIVLGAEELRHAASDLGRITGRVDVEEVLDVVFREFCIGK